MRLLNTDRDSQNAVLAVRPFVILTTIHARTIMEIQRPRTWSGTLFHCFPETPRSAPEECLRTWTFGDTEKAWTELQSSPLVPEVFHSPHLGGKTVKTN